MSLKKILVLMYCWATGMSNEAAITESSLNNGVTTGSHTVDDWFTFCREICLHVVQQKNSKGIGGPGKVVEIDESIYKYNRGRPADGKWVLGGVCHETEEVFLIEVQQRDSASLMPLIEEYVAAGSTVMTDCWNWYECLSQEDFKYLTVNHSINFVDPATGAQIKKSLPSTHTSATDRFSFRQAEYIWRRQNAGKDHFEQLLSDILLQYKPPQRF